MHSAKFSISAMEAAELLVEDQGVGNTGFQTLLGPSSLSFRISVCDLHRDPAFFAVDLHALPRLRLRAVTR
jgi:hypothetical protein